MTQCRWPLPLQIRLACRTLMVVDGFVDGIGFGLMVVGVVIFAIGLSRVRPEAGELLQPPAYKAGYEVVDRQVERVGSHGQQDR
jgi:hypothetical protein